ncbi:MAG: 50S ribosomal protein L25 [Bacteroides sp.]
MRVFELAAEPRSTKGRREARRMRIEEKIPAVIYGHGENVMCTLVERDLRDLLVTPFVQLVALTLNGKVEKVVLKEVQYHPVTDRPIHIDFYRYVEEEPITMAVPLVLQGHARGVKAGGKQVPGIRKLRVRGLAKNLPDYLPVDVSELRLGATLMVSDLAFENLEIVDATTQVVVSIRAQRGAKAQAQESEEE